MLWFKILITALLGILALFLIDQLGLWMERKGWIYWRKKQSSTSVLGAGTLELQNIFESGKAKHIIETKDAKQSENPNAGPGRA